MGFSEIELRADIDTARRYLETAAESGLPDAILLDLDLGTESGYDMLRIRYETPQLRSIPVVVWTHLGQENYEVCALFNIARFVSKWEGPTVLLDILAKLHAELNDKQARH